MGGISVGGSAVTVEQLLALTATQDRRAFELLHRRVCDRVTATARSLLRNHDLAQEVAQEVFVQIWQHADRYDVVRGSGLGWICGLTRARAIDRVRGMQAARTRDHVWVVGSLVLLPPTRDVDHRLMAESESADLQTALLRITPLQREAIVLAFFGERTHQQIAELLDLPLGTVKTRIRDGLRRLRTQLAGYHRAGASARPACRPQSGSPGPIGGAAA